MTSLQQRDPAFIDATPGDELPGQIPYMAQLGASGLRRNSGYVDDEWLPALRGRKAVKIYREISDNSPVIGGWFAAVSQLLRQIEWRVEAPTAGGADAKASAKFVEECMNDMSHSWGDMITEIASFVIYGWELSEVNYKRRQGPWYTNKANRNLHRSKYTDGKVGWASIQGRSQETMIRWVFSEAGDILGMVQQAPPRYQRKVLPMEKCLLFRTTIAKNNPEGRSFLRNCYEPWYYLKRHQEIEAIGVARDLTGVPIAKVPSKILRALPGTPDGMMLDAIKRLVTSVSRNEQEGIVWPQDIDPDSKLPNYDFSLLTSGGSRQFDTESIINRYKTEMLVAVLSDFMQVGHEANGGAYNMHTDKTGLFRTCLNALAQMIADVFNRQALPKLFELNGWKPAELPTIVPNNVDPPDLAQLGGFLQQLQNMGVVLFPDPELEKFVRDAAGIPQLDATEERQLETQRKQALLLALAQQRMEAIQLDQQAEQGAMGLEQQRQGLEAGPQQGAPGAPAGKPTDPNDKKKSDISVQREKVKLATDKAKLQNTKKTGDRPKPSRPGGRTPVRKFHVVRVQKAGTR